MARRWRWGLSGLANASRLTMGWRKTQSMRIRHGFARYQSIANIDAAGQRGLPLARFRQSKIGEKFNVAIGHVSQSLSGGPGVGRGHICHAIMNDAFFDKGWLV